MSDNAVPLFKMNGAGNKILVADLRGSEKPLTGKMAAVLGKNDMLHFDQLMAIEALRVFRVPLELSPWRISPCQIRH